MKLSSYNCYGFKSNKLMIKYLMNDFDVCFFSEHWLGDAENYLFNELCNNQSILFSSDCSNNDFDASRRKGRCFGGRCWVVKDEFVIDDYVVLNQDLSKLTVIEPSGVTSIIYGIWQPFDDGSHERLALLHSTLDILHNELLKISVNEVFIMGDFNADMVRGKRFDKLVCSFITN